MATPAYPAIALSMGIFYYCLSMHTELVALWGKAAYEHGGLGIEQEYVISIIYAFGAVVMLCFVNTVVLPMIRKFSPRVL
jgi:hypothetical protein